MHHDTRGRIIVSGGAKTTMLQFVVFDVLLWQGSDMMRRPYSERLSTLMTHAPPGQNAAVVVIPNGDRRVRTAADLEQIMRDAVEAGHEGCVLKDPTSTYKCKRARCVQKVKPRGPDINTCVVGIGFSLSNNPRRWGLLTGVRLNNTAIVTYCRTEVLEGDRLHRAFQHVYRDLGSRVSVKDVLRRQLQPQLLQQREVLCRAAGVYTVTVSSLNNNNRSDRLLKVEWRAHNPQQHRSCELVVLPDALDDVQWLVNPYEVEFALSMRGDLRPIERRLSEGTIIMMPRHPVGRLEFDPLSDDWDSPASAQRKFDEARVVATCIETWTLRRLAGVRAMPPNAQRMEELGRIVDAWMGDLNETWPKIPPSAALFSIDALGKVLAAALEKVMQRHGEQIPQALITAALRPLSLDERKAIAGLPPRTQWVFFDHKRNKMRGNDAKDKTNGEDEGEGRAMLDEERAFDESASDPKSLRERLETLKNDMPLYPVRSASFQAATTTRAHFATVVSCCSSPSSVYGDSEPQHCCDGCGYDENAAVPLLSEPRYFQASSHDEEEEEASDNNNDDDDDDHDNNDGVVNDVSGDDC